MSYEIAKLELKEGDILVVKMKYPTRATEIERMRDCLTKILPINVNFMFLDSDNVELSIVKKNG
jgi:hypothetical protein